MRYKILVITIVLLGIGLLSCGRKPTEAPGEIAWLHNIDSARVVAAEQDKPIMIDFMADWCPPCQQMEKTTFQHREVIARSLEFIPVRIDVDEQAEVAIAYNGNARKYGGVGIPNMLFIDSQDRRLRHKVGYRDGEQLLAVMDSVLSEYRLQ